MSWFVSPLLSGIMSGILFFLVRAFILRKVTFLLTTSRESHSVLFRLPGILSDVSAM